MFPEANFCFLLFYREGRSYISRRSIHFCGRWCASEVSATNPGFVQRGGTSILEHFHSPSTASITWELGPLFLGFPGSSVVKNPFANAGDIGDGDSIPGSGRSPGRDRGNPLQYSCLENPMNRGAWCLNRGVHRVSKSQTQL